MLGRRIHNLRGRLKGRQQEALKDGTQHFKQVVLPGSLHHRRLSCITQEDRNGSQPRGSGVVFVRRLDTQKGSGGVFD